jgi:hypothetical protein
MTYERFCAILNKHIFEGEKGELLRRLADNPERFIGLFRPTKPEGKILQYLLQSHEIRMGDALEELFENILKDLGFRILPKNLPQEEAGEQLYLDQYFTDGLIYYFVEQKVRDDHDSSKKRGQIANFEAKVEALSKRHGSSLIGILYFVDPDLTKNKNYYIQELKRMENFYGVTLHLLYGQEFFEFIGHSELWECILKWLKQWKDNLPELPEINFDAQPQQTFEEIKSLPIRIWRNLLTNEKLWEEGIMKAIFKEGKTLRLLLAYFRHQESIAYGNLANLLESKLPLLEKPADIK